MTTLLEEFYNNKSSNVNYFLTNLKNNYLDESRDVGYSKEAYNQISTQFEEYKQKITDLVKTLEVIGKGNLKYLSMKLDYNYYYSEIETHNNVNHNWKNRITNT